MLLEQKAREEEWRKEQQRKQDEIDLQEKLERERAEEETRLRQEQEKKRQQAELDKKRQEEQEQRKRDEEQKKRLEEIRAIELRQRKNDEMEVLAKFIYVDMLSSTIRDAVQETYFEQEYLEKERQQSLINKAEIKFYFTT